MTLGDLVVVLRKGELQQVGSPEELYERPVNLFVGGFIGSPAMNVVEATLATEDGGLIASFAGHRLRVPVEVANARPELARFDGRTVILGIRPEDMEDASLVPGSDPGSRFPASVALREGMGSDVFLHLPVDAPPVVTEDTRELASDVGENAVEELQAQASERRTTSIARVAPESSARLGATTELHVDTRKLYFFDPATGRSIDGSRTGAAVQTAGTLAD
jgi:multiple sugar transport system ATP-binding protein